MKPYEAMFLMDSGHAGSHWQERIDEIRTMLERHGCKIVRLVKWDDRRLAYAVKKSKRGIYVLAYYQAPNDANVKIERDVQLSDDLLRVLIIRREKLSEHDMLTQSIPSGEENIIGEPPPPPEPEPEVEAAPAAEASAEAEAAPQQAATAVAEQNDGDEDGDSSDDSSSDEKQA